MLKYDYIQIILVIDMSQFGIQIHTKADTKNSGNGTRRVRSRDKKRSEVGNYFSATKMSDGEHGLEGQEARCQRSVSSSRGRASRTF